MNNYKKSKVPLHTLQKQLASDSFLSVAEETEQEGEGLHPVHEADHPLIARSNYTDHTCTSANITIIKPVLLL